MIAQSRDTLCDHHSGIRIFSYKTYVIIRVKLYFCLYHVYETHTLLSGKLLSCEIYSKSRLRDFGRVFGVLNNV